MEIKDFIDFLNSEIKDQQKEALYGGWTSWAILAALAAIVWKLIEFLWLGDLNWLLTYTWILFFVLVTDYLTFIRTALSEADAQGKYGARFRVFTEIGPAPVVLFLLCKWTAAIIASWYLVKTTNWYYLHFATYLYALLVIVALGMLLTSMLSMPCIKNPDTESLRQRSASFILLILYAVPIVGFYKSWDPSRLSEREIKMAALFYATIFLYERYVVEKNPSNMVSSLKRIRRDLALEKISVSDAIKDADILLIGVPLKGVIGEDLRVTYEKISEIRKEFYGFRQLLNNKFPDFKQIKLPLNDEQKLKVEDFIKSWSGFKENTSHLLDDVGKIIPKITKELQFVRWLLPKEELAYIRQETEKLTQVLKETKNEINELTELLPNIT